MLGLIALTYETIPAQLTNRVGSCEKIDWAVPLSVSKLMARSSEIFIQKKKMTAAGSKSHSGGMELGRKRRGGHSNLFGGRRATY